MSSSNIIRLHILRPTARVVGVIGSRLFESGAIDGDGASATSDRVAPPATIAEAAEIVAQARREAETIVASARAEAEEMRKEASEKGFAKGYAEGQAEARHELTSQIQCLAGLAQIARIDRGSLLHSAEGELVQLALAVAEKVVHKELDEDKALVVALVRGGLEYVDSLDVIRIRANPADVDILQANWEELGLVRSHQSIELLSDLKVQLGGCVIEAKSAVVDAQLETKLAEIEAAFRAELDADRNR